MHALKLGFAGFENMGQGHRLIITLHPKLRHKLKAAAIFDPEPSNQEKALNKGLAVHETFDELIGADGIDAVPFSIFS